MDGQALAQRRHARGLTQEQLAHAARLSVSTVRRIEHGRVAPRRSTLALLALALEQQHDLSDFAGLGTGRRQRNPAGAVFATVPAGYAPTSGTVA